jgi:hypothetical protein
MTKSILVSLAILTLSTSVALAAHRTHHRHAMNAYAATGAPAGAGTGGSPVVWTGGVSNSNHTMYMQNLRESGYDPKKNFNASGNLVTQ